MAKVELSRSDEWELEHESQDVRGWEVVDASGKRMGTVTDLIIDTDRERVDTLVLDSGERVAAAAASLGDHVVRLGSTTGESGSDSTRSVEPTSDRTAPELMSERRDERQPLIEEQLRIGRRSMEPGLGRTDSGLGGTDAGLGRTDSGIEGLRPRDGDRTSVMPPSTIEDPSLRESRMGGSRLGESPLGDSGFGESRLGESRLDDAGRDDESHRDSSSFEPGSGSFDSGSASLSSAERRRSERNRSDQKRSELDFSERERLERERRERGGSLGPSSDPQGTSGGL